MAPMFPTGGGLLGSCDISGKECQKSNKEDNLRILILDSLGFVSEFKNEGLPFLKT
jgi:hypothetical protein